LVASAVGKGLSRHQVSRRQLLIKFRSGIGMSNRNLDRLHIQFFRKIERSLDRFLCFSRQADDEVSMDLDPDLFTVLRELPRMLDGCTLLDILQNLRITGFVSNDEQPRSCISHCLQGLIVTGHASCTRPAESQRLELRANVENTVFAVIEGLVVEEN